MSFKDDFKHQGLRKRLIEEIKSKGFADQAILDAIGRVPRHLFMDNAFLKFAYEDKPFPIGAGQTISQPYTVALQTSLLELQKREKVLEIGTGSGYQAAVLLELSARVFTIERQKPLYDRAIKLLPKLGYNPKFFYGDGYKGLPSFAPFDKILVTAGAPFVPEELKEQLKVGGKLVIPVGEQEIQVMYTITRTGQDSFEEEDHGQFRFVPLLGDRQW